MIALWLATGLLAAPAVVEPPVDPPSQPVGGGRRAVYVEHDPWQEAADRADRKLQARIDRETARLERAERATQAAQDAPEGQGRPTPAPMLPVAVERVSDASAAVVQALPDVGGQLAALLGAEVVALRGAREAAMRAEEEAVALLLLQLELG